MGENNQPTRRRFLSSVGKATGSMGALSAFGIQNVVAKKGKDSNSREIIKSTEVKNAVKELEKYTPGNSPVNFKHNKSESVKVQFEGRDTPLKFTSIPTRYGMMNYLEYGDFGRSICFVDPESLPASVPASIGPEDMEKPGNGPEKRSGPNQSSGRGGQIWIDSSREGAITYRSLNSDEKKIISDQIEADDFIAFTHSETSNIIIGCEEETAKDDTVMIYQGKPDEKDPLLTECHGLSIENPRTIQKGGFAEEAIDDEELSPDGGLACEGYCATNGALCLMEMEFCAMCAGATCAASLVAWPAIAACIACVLGVCGTAWLPQVGSCVTALDCLRESIDDGLYDLPEYVDFPDWYTNPAGADTPCN